ncbi:Adenosylcobalamin-dependent ribonucleoside-triphosphate reductase [Dirofilaria immitis]
MTTLLDHVQVCWIFPATISVDYEHWISSVVIQAFSGQFIFIVVVIITFRSVSDKIRIDLCHFQQFHISLGIDCSNLTHINSKCEMICPRNDPNCTIKHQTDEEVSLLKSATIFEKKTVGDYVYGDEIRTNGKLSLLRPDASGFCTHLYKQPIKYKVNYAVNCRWHFHAEKGCNVDDLVKFFSNQINSTEVCDRNGDQCVASILKDVTAASSDQKCDNYSVMSVRLIAQQGSILGMLIEFRPSPNKCRERYCLLTTEISFQEIKQKFLDKMQMSRYENSEGCFRCPSEVACLTELFYFLNMSDLRAFSAQFLVFINTNCFSKII